MFRCVSEVTWLSYQMMTLLALVLLWANPESLLDK